MLSRCFFLITAWFQISICVLSFYPILLRLLFFEGLIKIHCMTVKVLSQPGQRGLEEDVLVQEQLYQARLYHHSGQVPSA